MDGFFGLVFMFLYLFLLNSSAPMPANHHHKHGVLESIDQCNEDQLKHISDRLEHTFTRELVSSDLSLPPTETSVHVFIYVTYKVFDSKIVEFEIKSAEFTSEGNVPVWKIKASVKVVGGYKYSHTFSSDSGTYVLTMDHVTMYMIGNKCQIDLGKPHKEFSGNTANWGYKTYIKGTSKDDDNRDLKDKLCHYVQRIYNEVLSKASCHPKTTTTIAPSTLMPTETSVMHAKEVTDPKNVPDEKHITNVVDKNDTLVDDPLPDSSNEELFPPTEVVHHPLTDELITSTTTIALPSKDKINHFKHHEYDSFPNDEPLDIPGYLPFVDPEEENKGLSKGIRNSASNFSSLLSPTTIIAFIYIYFWHILLQF